MSEEKIRINLYLAKAGVCSRREADRLVEAGRVKVDEQDGMRVKYTVAGQPPQTVTIERDLTIRCDCMTFIRKGCCRHAVAAWLEAERAKIPGNAFSSAASCAPSAPKAAVARINPERAIVVRIIIFSFEVLRRIIPHLPFITGTKEPFRESLSGESNCHATKPSSGDCLSSAD